MSKQPENPFKNYEDYMAKGPFQTIKLLLPFLPAKNHKNMVILLKFLELKYTMDFFKQGNRISFCSNLQEDASPLEKISSMIDFLPPKEQESIEQMLGMISMMEAFQTMNAEEDSESESCTGSRESPASEPFSDFQTSPASRPVAASDDSPQDAPSDAASGTSDTSTDVSEKPDITICSNIHF